MLRSDHRKRVDKLKWVGETPIQLKLVIVIKKVLFHLKARQQISHYTLHFTFCMFEVTFVSNIIKKLIKLSYPVALRVYYCKIDLKVFQLCQ